MFVSNLRIPPPSNCDKYPFWNSLYFTTHTRSATSYSYFKWDFRGYRHVAISTPLSDTTPIGAFFSESMIALIVRVLLTGKTAIKAGFQCPTAPFAQRCFYAVIQTGIIILNSVFASDVLYICVQKFPSAISLYHVQSASADRLSYRTRPLP